MPIILFDSYLKNPLLKIKLGLISFLSKSEREREIRFLKGIYHQGLNLLFDLSPFLQEDNLVLVLELIPFPSIKFFFKKKLNIFSLINSGHLFCGVWMELTGDGKYE